MNVVTREMKSKHAAADGITTTGLFVATAAAAAAGAALKTAVDKYKNASDDSALERAFNALVHEFFTNTDYTTTEDGDSARELCLNKLRSFTTFASQRHKIPKYLIFFEFWVTFLIIIFACFIIFSTRPGNVFKSTSRLWIYIRFEI